MSGSRRGVNPSHSQAVGYISCLKTPPTRFYIVRIYVYAFQVTVQFLYK